MTEFILKVRPMVHHPSCYKPYLDSSGKVIIPQSVLKTLMDMSGNTIFSPIAFLLLKDEEVLTSVGVEEFSAEEGYIYLPSFLIETYWIPYDTEIKLKFHKPEKGTRISLEPHQTAFIDSNAKDKTFLENYLKKGYPVLKKGCMILIKDGEQEYYINIVDTLPSEVISTLDTDLEVEFMKPLDYVDPPPPPLPKVIEEMPMPKGHFVPFAGKGYRLGHGSD